MISALLIASIFVTWLARRKSKVSRSGLSGQIQTKFWEHTFEFAAILSGVLLFFHALLLLSYWGWQVVSVGNLMWLEGLLTRVQKFVGGTLKISWETSLLILLVIYVLGLFRVRLFESGVVGKRYKSARKALRLANKAAILLCAFTVLGHEAGTPATALQVRIRTARHDYGVLRSQVMEALTERAGRSIDHQISDRFPVAYHDISGRAEKRDDANANVRQDYQALRDSYNVRDARAEALVRRDRVRRAAYERVDKASPPESTNSSIEAEPPTRTTYRDIQAAQEAVRNYSESFRSEVGRLATSAGGKDTLTHFQKLVTSKIPPSLARLIGEAHPEIVPLFEVMSETLDDALKYKIEQAVDKLAKDAVSQPSDVARNVQAAADEIAKDTKMEVTKAQATAAAKQALNIDTEIKEGNRISAALNSTARRLKNEKLDRMIAQLRSTSAAERERAIELLAANGGDLNTKQVARLKQMLRDDETWQTAADRPEGHHCTDYEYKTLGYYSGRAIQRIESPYVDDSLRAEARRAESKGSYSRRVTDPGWV